MTTGTWFASLVLVATIVSAPAAETHCPGNVASLPFRFVNGQQIVLPVSINHTGPYNFLLDSGTQSTIIALTLAAALHLDTQGAAVVAGVGSRKSFAQVDLIEVGAHVVANQKVIVYDLEKLDSADLHLQGNFLEHFNVLIDNANRLLCLDNSATTCAEVKGSRIPLLARAEADGGGLLIITASLSAGLRPVRLLLDSGANVAILFNTFEYMALQLSYNEQVRGSGVDGMQRIFSALPPQDVNIGSLEVPQVHFIGLAGIRKDVRIKGFDGDLPTGLFRRVFIDNGDHFAVLEPRWGPILAAYALRGLFTYRPVSVTPIVKFSPAE
jgi:hypothetical protein